MGAPEYLCFLSGRRAGEREPLRHVASGIVLGRGKDVDVYVPDMAVERRHARLTMTPDGLVLEDLLSANGVYMAGRPVRRCVVQKGDVIELGGARLRLE